VGRWPGAGAGWRTPDDRSMQKLHGFRIASSSCSSDRRPLGCALHNLPLPHLTRRLLSVATSFPFWRAAALACSAPAAAHGTPPLGQTCCSARSRRGIAAGGGDCMLSAMPRSDCKRSRPPRLVRGCSYRWFLGMSPISAQGALQLVSRRA
jgi:hypothetical protein